MTQIRPLVEILAEIPDFRKEKGKRHPLSAILALACVSMMCEVILLWLNRVVTMARSSLRLLASLIKGLLVLQPSVTYSVR
jgi:hypothetical protein